MKKTKPRIIILCHRWPSTKNNHAGMFYFSRSLKKYLGFPVRLIYNPHVYRAQWLSWLHQFHWQASKLVIRHAVSMLKKDDTLFFTEYLMPLGSGGHADIALSLRKQGIRNRMVGLMHFPEKALLETFSMEYIHSALGALDDIIVFGSSLAGFLARIGHGHKTKTLLHYVDTDYYHPAKENRTKEKFVVIIFGILWRNWLVMREIVHQCPEASFIIFMTYSNFKPMFEGLPNVELHKYVPESELLAYLHRADVSLSGLDDTVASNSIVTSLACGLPQIVSDVGSIRDYCSEENTIFCRGITDFVHAVNLLSNNRELRLRMGQSARRRAEELSLSKSIGWYRNFFEANQR